MYTKKILTGSFGLLGLSLALLVGCQSSTASSATTPTKVMATTFADDAGSTRGAAAIWATTCSHCHNSRSPAEFNDAQWEVIMMHMRNQARLTADEANTVLKFLQSAN